MSWISALHSHWQDVIKCMLSHDHPTTTLILLFDLFRIWRILLCFQSAYPQYFTSLFSCAYFLAASRSSVINKQVILVFKHMSWNKHYNESYTSWRVKLVFTYLLNTLCPQCDLGRNCNIRPTNLFLWCICICCFI